jgi:hypothetical protein
MGWQIEKPVNLEEKALQFAPKALSLGCSVHSSEGARKCHFYIFSLVTRANFFRAVIMWGGKHP